MNEKNRTSAGSLFNQTATTTNMKEKSESYRWKGGGGGGRGYDSGKFTAWDSKEVTEEERAARERVQY